MDADILHATRIRRAQVVFAMAWNQREDMVNKFRLAIGSYIEEYNNKVQVRCRQPFQVM